MKERLAKPCQNRAGAELHHPAPWVDLTVRNEHQFPSKAAARFLLLSLRGALHTQLCYPPLWSQDPALPIASLT